MVAGQKMPHTKSALTGEILGYSMHSTNQSTGLLDLWIAIPRKSKNEQNYLKLCPKQ